VKSKDFELLTKQKSKSVKQTWTTSLRHQQRVAGACPDCWARSG
jgi:hypothetical protein